MIIINDKELRNLEEQVGWNKDQIEKFIEQGRIADLGVNILSVEPLPDASYLPQNYTGKFGDAYLVGTETPYDLYVWTRGDKWFDWGPLNAPSIIPGPQGPKGDKGDKGNPGSLWYVGSGAPTLSANYNTGDMYLDVSTGSVYRLSNTGNWGNVGNIRGPQGLQGIQGIQGLQGIQGIQGAVGPQGEPGKPFRIGGVLSTTDALPTPSEEIQNIAYLVGSADNYNMYVIVGDDSNPYIWVNLGKVTAIEGPVGPQGIQGPAGATGAKGENGHPIYYSSLTSAPINLSSIQPQEPRVAVGDLVVNSAGELCRVNIVDVQYNEIDWQVLTSLVGPAGASPTGITITPETATQGTLTADQLSTLQANDFNYIVLNKELYSLQDKSHEEGYLVYTHVGMDTTKNTFIKTITITLNTRGWILTSTAIPKIPHCYQLKCEYSTYNSFAYIIGYVYSDEELQEFKDPSVGATNLSRYLYSIGYTDSNHTIPVSGVKNSNTNGAPSIVCAVYGSTSGSKIKGILVTVGEKSKATGDIFEYGWTLSKLY